MHRLTRLRLTAEFLLLYAGGPALILALRSRLFMAAFLWLATVYVILHLKRRFGLSPQADWNWAAFKGGWRIVLVRFAALAVPLTAGAWWLLPQGHLFGLPRHAPGLWIAILILYPVLSVWPQEVIYRSLLRHRYATLFGEGNGFIAASAVAFGFAHIILLNAYVVAFTTVGGVLLAHTYRSSRSLALACLEHALYGCLLFTLGFGLYFYTGAAWHL